MARALEDMMGLAEAQSAQRLIRAAIDGALAELDPLVAAFSAELASIEESRETRDDLALLDAQCTAAAIALGSLRSASDLMRNGRSTVVGNG